MKRSGWVWMVVAVSSITGCKKNDGAQVSPGEPPADPSAVTAGGQVGLRGLRQAGEWPPVEEGTADLPVEELICRHPRVMYFVDFLGAPPPADYHTQLAKRLSDAANEGGGPWFEPRAAGEGPIVAVVSKVLSENVRVADRPDLTREDQLSEIPQYRWRADGSRRFLRVHFR